jgi:hypothetical protein
MRREDRRSIMRRRVRGLAAVAVASAAIGGVLASPASADAPLANYSYTCLVGSIHVSGSSTTPITVGDAHRTIAGARRSCDRGTLEYTIERL